MDYFEIGKIVNTVGVKGEIKVFPTTEDMRRFDLLDEITIVGLGGRIETWPIEKVRYHRNLVMLRLIGVDNVDKAAKFRGSTIVISREKALPLGEGEFYVPDLLGLTVVDDQGHKLGVLTDVLVTGANDVYVVKKPDGKEILIPAIKQCILNVDIENGIMTVRLLEGL
jgi:16S rRNA processing protein RimM